MELALPSKKKNTFKLELYVPLSSLPAKIANRDSLAQTIETGAHRRPTQ